MCKYGQAKQMMCFTLMLYIISCILTFRVIVVIVVVEDIELRVVAVVIISKTDFISRRRVGNVMVGSAQQPCIPEAELIALDEAPVAGHATKAVDVVDAAASAHDEVMLREELSTRSTFRSEQPRKVEIKENN